MPGRGNQLPPAFLRRRPDHLPHVVPLLRALRIKGAAIICQLPHLHMLDQRSMKGV